MCWRIFAHASRWRYSCWSELSAAALMSHSTTTQIDREIATSTMCWTIANCDCVCYATWLWSHWRCQHSLWSLWMWSLLSTICHRRRLRALHRVRWQCIVAVRLLRQTFSQHRHKIEIDSKNSFSYPKKFDEFKIRVSYWGGSALPSLYFKHWDEIVFLFSSRSFLSFL